MLLPATWPGAAEWHAMGWMDDFTESQWPDNHGRKGNDGVCGAVLLPPSADDTVVGCRYPASVTPAP